MYNFLCYRYSAMLEGGWGRTVGVGATPRLLAAVVAILSHLLLFLLLSNAPSALGEEGVVAPAPSELLPHLLDGQAAREPKIDSKFSALLFIILYYPIIILIIIIFNNIIFILINLITYFSSLISSSALISLSYYLS